MLERFLETIMLSWRDLTRQKLRSFLTGLGVVFGIASVVSMMAVGQGAQNQILEQIRSLGLNNILIRSVKPIQQNNAGSSGSWTQTYGLSLEDYRLLKETLPSIDKISPLKNHSSRIWNGPKRKTVELKGVEHDFFGMIDLPLLQGRTIRYDEDKGVQNVCIVPDTILSDLNLPIEIGQRIRLQQGFFKVIGIYQKDQLPSMLKSSYGPVVFIPYQVSSFKLGIYDRRVSEGSWEATMIETSEVICRIRDEKDVLEMAQLIDQILSERLPRGDFELDVPLLLLKQKQETQRIFNMVMILIATISLAVGGIGIVNIMLATISERTKEIGIRRAIGAKQKDIILQFLIETLTLTILSGLVGCLFGFFVVQGIQKVTGWVASFHPLLFIYAMLIACITGVLFGLYPARKAAKLDPILALRHD